MCTTNRDVRNHTYFFIKLFLCGRSLEEEPFKLLVNLFKVSFMKTINYNN